MARNAPAAYGRDLKCISDADPLWSSVVGLDVVRQHALHRLTNDSVLGPGGSGWGFDCRRLIGMPASDLSAMQPFLSEVLTRDPRVDTADVTLSQVLSAGGDVVDVRIEVVCTTAQGPFSLVKNVSELTSADITGQEP